jgi:DNA-binding PadR family transcriptional regulator
MSSRTLPPVTHLQFLILDALTSSEQAGRDLRELLAGFGVRNSGPAFYQMMARLESSDLVEGRYDQKQVEGQHVKQRRYRLTTQGQHAVETTRAFYAARASTLRPARRSSHG